MSKPCPWAFQRPGQSCEGREVEELVDLGQLHVHPARQTLSWEVKIEAVWSIFEYYGFEFHTLSLEWEIQGFFLTLPYFLQVPWKWICWIKKSKTKGWYLCIGSPRSMHSRGVVGSSSHLLPFDEPAGASTVFPRWAPLSLDPTDPSLVRGRSPRSTLKWP